MDKISIIIRNRNEQDYIGFAIQSCLDFFERPEIIVVDNNSTDSSIEIVNLFSDRTDIKILYNKSYTPGKSINLGVKNSTSDYIMILSAHSQIKELDFEIVKDNLKKHSAVFGKQIPVYKGKKITPRYIWNHFGDEKVVNMFSKSEKRYFFHNAFSFFKKNTLEKFPFDEIHPGKEDRFWVNDLIENKGTYVYEPRLQINHFYTQSGATWKGIG
tara:strand:- start:938 stop:1579 length:642 start_codon:yes stop_codon:yes gene_type:complete